MTRPAQPDVDLGVIYTHEDGYLPPLLSTLAASGDGLSMRLLLVDNASRNGAEQWCTHFPRVEVLRNERRLHYAANLNRILAASTAPFVLLLNTDMYFEPREQTIARLVWFLRQTPACGLASCRLYHPDGTYGHPARRFQTLRTISARRLGLGRLFARSARDYVYADRDREDTFPCDWVSGCLMFVRREAYEAIGPLDESFSKYFEDVDYCLRMQRGGWSVMFHGATYAWHWEQRASKRLWRADAWKHIRSYARFVAKWGVNPAQRAAELTQENSQSEKSSKGNARRDRAA